MSSQIPELAERLILDGTKVGWYPERIAAWRRGEKIAPITIDCAMTRACNAACDFCYASLQASEGEKITKQHFFDFLADAAAIGVKGVSFISDGESSVVPWYADAVEYAASVGLAVGAGSNGIKLTKPVLERVLPHLSYLRFNFSAGERKRYAEIMGVPQHFYDDVIQNIRDGMEIINRDKLGCTLNVQMVCAPHDGDQIIPFAKLVCELRPSYGIIKHCADDKEGTLGVDYTQYAGLTGDLQQAETLGKAAGIRIAVKWNRIESKCQRSYTSCHGPNFIMQLSGNGEVAPCGFMFAEQHRKLHIGNITRQRFKDIWASERWTEVMAYLGSDHWNSQKRCGPGCLQNPTNEYLSAYIAGRVELPTTPPPAHLEFI